METFSQPPTLMTSVLMFHQRFKERAVTSRSPQVSDTYSRASAVELAAALALGDARDASGTAVDGGRGAEEDGED